MFDRFKDRIDSMFNSSGLEKNSYDPHERLKSWVLFAFLVWILALFL